MAIEKPVTFYTLFNLEMLFVTLVTTETLKKLIRRDRPPIAPTPRIHNLRLKEHGTLSMPSGDTTQAALWSMLMTLFFHQWAYLGIIIPVVAFSRVYFKCHWVGDTLAGAGLGMGLGYAAWIFYSLLTYPFALFLGSN